MHHALCMLLYPFFHLVEFVKRAVYCTLNNLYIVLRRELRSIDVCVFRQLNSENVWYGKRERGKERKGRRDLRKRDEVAGLL